MKKILLLISLMLLCVLAFSCGNTQSDNDDDATQMNNANTHVFQSDQIVIAESNFILASWVHDGRIFYYHIALDASNQRQIVVTNMLPDGTDRENINIPISANGRVIAAHMSNEGLIGVLEAESDDIVYIAYDLAANEQFRRAFEDVNSDIINQIQENVQAGNVHFTNCEKIVIAIDDAHGSVLHILDIESGSAAEIQFWDRQFPDVVSLDDGRVIAGFRTQGGIVFSEIDVSAGVVVLDYHSEVSNLQGILPAGNDMQFDIIVNDGSHLFGYSLETGERTNLLNWVETGFSNVTDAHIAMLADGRFSVLTGDWDDEWVVNLHILTPTLRETPADVITLTLGGLFIFEDVRQAVVEFNRENSLLQIQINDYWGDGAGTWEAAELRLRTELITGEGPDILYSPEDAMSDRGFLIDLYPFLDADSEIERSDFFPNALQALESADGSLTEVTSGFNILTMIGTTNTVGHFNSWTSQDLLELANNITTDMQMPFGTWMDREEFIRIMIQFSNDDFINWSTMEANLDSEEFIHLLETAYRLPSSIDFFSNNEITDEYAQLRNGEQLLTLAFLPNPERYQGFSVGLGQEEIEVLGIPTERGGIHVLQPYVARLGINANSDNAESAWLFLRRFLLPSANTESMFPLRIDLYNDAITKLMTPIMENGIEIPRVEWMLSDGSALRFFTMTEAEADAILSIAESAVPVGRRVNDSLWAHIQEDLAIFFSGNRNAQDTARIMQNRVQIYLSEQMG